MAPDPKLICGDLNALQDALPTLHEMIIQEGWTDVGCDPRLCQGKPAQSTCHANANAKESRIDYVIANDRLYPAVNNFWFDQDANYPTHKPLCIEVKTKKLHSETNEMQRPTNFANLFEEKVMEEVAAQQVKDDKKSEEEGKESKAVDQYAIRKDNLRRLHEHMDKQVDKRKHRLQHAAANKDTTTQWDLIAAASEEAVIDFLQLQGKEASKMRGRSIK